MIYVIDIFGVGAVESYMQTDLKHSILVWRNVSEKKLPQLCIRHYVCLTLPDQRAINKIKVIKIMFLKTETRPI